MRLYQALPCLFLTLIPFLAESQKVFYDEREKLTEEGTNTAYFSLPLENVKVKDSSSLDHVTVITKYYMSGKLYSVGGYVDESAELRVGPYQSLYENGMNKAKGNFKHNQRFGLWKDWYPNGQLKSMIRFESPMNPMMGPSFTVDSYYDSLGHALVRFGDGFFKYEDFPGWAEGRVSNGKKDGIWKGYMDNGLLAYEEYYKNGEFMEGKFFEGGGVLEYEDLFLNALPKGGYQEFYNWVGSQMNYPKKARKQGVQGKVYVAFVVNSDGTISDVKTIKGISLECDLEAERVLKMSSNWEPGHARGRPMSQKIILPITFTLD